MSEYIDREALFKTVEDYASVHPVMSDNELFALFCSIPAADVRPVVRARWVPNVPPRDLRPRCSSCGDLNPVKANFCPNCGAEMKEGEA